jgi:hypothetical protein
VGFVEINVVSRLDTTRSCVVVPDVEIGGTAVEEDVIERVAIELGGTVTGDTGSDEGTESTKWDSSGFSLKYASYSMRQMALCLNRFLRYRACSSAPDQDGVGGLMSIEDSVP